MLHLFVDLTTEHELTLEQERNRYQKIMIASLTHELRTPLNASTAALHVLDEFVPSCARDHLQTAIASNKMLKYLI